MDSKGHAGRQRLPAMAYLTSFSPGLGFFNRAPFAAMIIPAKY